MKKVIILACLLFPSLAFAQYRSASSPSGIVQPTSAFPNRTGKLMYGGSIGIGAMSDAGGEISCSNCDTAAAQVSAHVGGFVEPQLALMGELQGNFQTLHSDAFTGDTSVLTQATLMFAGQYWASPRLWLKGGVGFATLQVDRSYYGDDIIDESTVPESGLALMAAVGYEVMATPGYSIEVQGRLVDGAYDSINYHLTAISVGVGVNWY
jgi:hypothetical protein